jgi:catechol 2,3-dioxygenase-like lactoylglutathione lyase family enzyme
MVKKLAHVCIGSSNLDATRKFYCGCLGLKEHFNFIKEGKNIGTHLEICHGSYLEFFTGNPKIHEDNVIRHICFEVGSIDELIERLRKDGYEVTDKKMGTDKSWQAWTSDPDGVKIEFHEYTLTSSQMTKKDCVLS